MVGSMTGLLAGILMLTSIATDSAHIGRSLAVRQMSLENRYAEKSVNEVFSDNILLNLAYMRGSVKTASDINWEEIRKPFSYSLTLEPDQLFAYHDSVLSEFSGQKTVTTNAHFNAQEGFRSSGYLYGDGVCHLASLIEWAAKDAGLEVVYPTAHDFAVIPEVPREHGVSIYYMPGQDSANARQNLYIKNTTGKKVNLVFEYKDNILSVNVVESASGI